MRRRDWAGRATAAAVIAAAFLLLPGSAASRPNYFATFVGIYGFVPGDDLHNCGVCHRRWEGTGARNPFGVEVEQQLYIGKTITQAILDVEPLDTDLDGFTNVDELTVHGTLPGYSCDNYTLVINPPVNFQSLITPGVPSCLEPIDIMVEPSLISMLSQVNEVETVGILITNNGTDDPIVVSNYEMLAGSHPTLGLSGPTAPVVIPVGQTATIDLSFSPVTSTGASGTIRISSNDPDEPTIDIPVTAISFVKNLAPAADRAACFAEAEKRMEHYTRTHLNEWGRCYLDELAGVACDTGRRDTKIAASAAALRSFVGGAKDKKCAGNGITPTRLDLPTTCPAPCEGVAMGTIAGWADCLVCQQDAATETMLQQTIGVTPPDLPPEVLATLPQRCERLLVRGVRNAIRKVQKKLGACRLANVTAGSPVDCDATLAADIAVEEAKVDELLSRCRDTTGLAGCLFEMTPAPQCLSDMATSVSGDLVDAIFDTAD